MKGLIMTPVEFLCMIRDKANIVFSDGDIITYYPTSKWRYRHLKDIFPLNEQDMTTRSLVYYVLVAEGFDRYYNDYILSSLGDDIKVIGLTHE